MWIPSVWSSVWARGDHLQLVQADHRNHALHAVQGDLRYHAVQQYLEVQGYQQDPKQDVIVGSQQRCTRAGIM